MVAYRSFMPFLPLLKSNIPAVQLWATWGILHVCTKNAARYVPLLINDGLQDIMRLLSVQEDQHAILQELSAQVWRKANEYMNSKDSL
ncbi:Protein zyg-11-like [Exaiptasia diaphana]|nr:Protein zyg-11-like [Exaiptasia diaphana]